MDPGAEAHICAVIEAFAPGMHFARRSAGPLWPPEEESNMERIEETRVDETTEPSIEELELQWWQPLSCGCDPTTEE